jgi:hypothetical protein
MQEKILEARVFLSTQVRLGPPEGEGMEETCDAKAP